MTEEREAGTSIPKKLLYPAVWAATITMTGGGDPGFWPTSFINFDTDVTNPDGRILILSNSPEAFKNSFGVVMNETSVYEPINLYKAELDLTGNETQPIRLWFWHLNSLNVNVAFKIIMHVTAGTATVSSVKEHIEHDVSGDLSIPAICLAKRQHAKDLDSGSGMTLTGSGQSLVSLSMAAGKLTGGIVEFDIEASETCKLRIRFMASRNQQNGGWNTRVWNDPTDSQYNAYDLANGTDHIRGWWPQSNFEATHTEDPFDLLDQHASTEPEAEDFQNLSMINQGGIHLNSTNGRFRGGRSEDPYGSAGGNKGLYGVDVTFNVPVKNTSGQSRPLMSFIAARNAGPYLTQYSKTARGKFWGAATIQGHLEEDYRGVPKLIYGGEGENLMPFPEGADWFCELNETQWAATTGSNVNDVKFDVVIGAASDLPASIVLKRLQQAPNDPPGGTGR